MLNTIKNTLIYNLFLQCGSTPCKVPTVLHTWWLFYATLQSWTSWCWFWKSFARWHGGIVGQVFINVSVVVCTNIELYISIYKGGPKSFWSNKRSFFFKLTFISLHNFLLHLCTFPSNAPTSPNKAVLTFSRTRFWSGVSKCSRSAFSCLNLVIYDW